METEKCPVCWRWIAISSSWRMRQHDDTAGNPCLMSGHETPPENHIPISGKEISDGGLEDFEIRSVA